MTTSHGTEHDHRLHTNVRTYASGTPGTNEAGLVDRQAGHETHAGHGAHGLMMIICCIPVLLLVGVLAVTGVGGSAVIVPALVCIAVMAAMVYAMPGEHIRHSRR